MVINLYPFQKRRAQFFRKPYALAEMASAAHIKNETEYDPKKDISLMYGQDPYKGRRANAVSNYVRSLDNPETLTNNAYVATTVQTHAGSGTSPFDLLSQDQPVRPVSADPIRTYDARRARFLALAASAPPTTCLPGFTAQIRGTPPNVTVSCVPAPKGSGTIPTNPITDPFSTHQPSTNTSSVATKPSSSSSSSSTPSTLTLPAPPGLNFSQIMNWLKANPTADMAIAAVIIVLILVGVRIL